MSESEFHNTMKWILKSFIITNNRNSEKFQKVKYFLWRDIFTGKTVFFIRKTMFSIKIYAGDRKTGDYKIQ